MDLSNNRIKQIMKKQGITQIELGKMTGIAQSDLSKIIAGKKELMALKTAAKIATALGYSIEYIWPSIYD
jgi:transcriptional regulator with XRE-family HTH domain